MASDSAIARFYYAFGVPFVIAKSPYFKDALFVIQYLWYSIQSNIMI